MAKVTIDGVEHETEELSEQAQNTIRSLQFVEQQVQQRHNELAVADTARAAYLRALKTSLAPHKTSD
jgi:parvulin-like peptidyl-prolyl isomerase